MEPARPVLLIALIAVYFFWGSTLAAMRYADQTIPPFLMAGIRYFISAALMFALALPRLHGQRPTRRQWLSAAVSGLCLLLIGNGIVAWSVLYISTGVVSLLIALTPLWMAVFDFVLFRNRPPMLTVVGIALGVLGMALLVNPLGAGAPALVPALIVIAASVAWAFGSIYQRLSPPGDDVFLASSMQMLVGSVGLLAVAFVRGEWSHFSFAQISATSWGGLAWLVIAGSMIGYSAFVWLMRNASVALASTYSYVNPLVAMGIGALLFHETLTPRTAIAALVMLSGIALMLAPKPKRASVAHAA